MRLYELMFITRPDLDEEKVSSVIGKYQDIITSTGGQVKKQDKWGKRRLAYEIDGQREGVYVLITFEGEPALTRELDRLMKIDADLLRHMIVRASPSSLEPPKPRVRRGRPAEAFGATEREEGHEPRESGEPIADESPVPTPEGQQS
ncbi:MAG TPA: 30S ribosomal protein S6 [Firmicutes bacterium]|nr:30S ribosomal protein S6 [Candidatus Fermentithermobacillaceae bacterium]